MVLVFRTDGSVTHRGFSARYDTDQPALCGGELSVPTGYFVSPGFTSSGVGNYSDSLLCEWQLSTVNSDSVGNASVAFTIESMSIEGPIQSTSQCAFDSLEFFGGNERTLTFVSTCFQFMFFFYLRNHRGE